MRQFELLDAAVEQLCKLSGVSLERGPQSATASDIIAGTSFWIRGFTSLKFRLMTVEQAVTIGFAGATLANRSDWIRRMELVRIKAELAASPELTVEAPPPFKPPFVLTDFQARIFDALKGVAMKKDKLAAKVCRGEGTRLYRKNGIKELLKENLVCHKHGLGYYRPDAPPNRH
jgi:hypothetical protein